MEIILRETIDNLGRAGQVVKVANGYARNYLLPRKLAYPATPGNLKVIEFERQSLLKKEARQKEDAEKAVDYYKKAYALDPTSTVIGEQLAEMYFASQQTGEAITEAQSVLKRDASNVGSNQHVALRGKSLARMPRPRGIRLSS